MALAALTRSQAIDTLYTYTWQKRIETGTAMDNVFEITPFFALLHRLGQSGAVAGKYGPQKKPWRGGTFIEFPAILGKNTTVQSIGRGEAVTLTDTDHSRTGKEEWRDVTGHIMRFRNDDRANKGEAMIMNQMQVDFQVLEKSFAETMEEFLFSTAAAGSDDPLGLPNLISATPTVGTVHGLSRATYAGWRNQARQANAAGFGVEGMNDLRATRREVQKFFGRPNLIMTSADIFGYVEEEADEYKVIQNKAIAELNFDSVVPFRGTDIMWSPQYTDDDMYFLDTRFIYWAQDPDHQFTMGEWIPVPDQPLDRVAHSVNTGNLLCVKMNAQAILYTITE